MSDPPRMDPRRAAIAYADAHELVVALADHTDIGPYQQAVERLIGERIAAVEDPVLGEQVAYTVYGLALFGVGALATAESALHNLWETVSGAPPPPETVREMRAQVFEAMGRGARPLPSRAADRVAPPSVDEPIRSDTVRFREPPMGPSRRPGRLRPRPSDAGG